MAMIALRSARVDVATGQVQRPDAGPSRLTPTERALLQFLVDHPDRDLSRRELLTEVWGYRPSITSRTLDTTVKTLRRKIERDPTAPDHLLTAWGTGYRFTARTETPTGPESPPPAALVGRSRELAAIEDALAGGARWVTLAGPGGVGKTRLALELGRRRVDARWVDLGAATDDGDVAIAAGVVVDGDPSDLGRALVLLDNAEQVCDAVRALVEGWLAASAELAVVVTSRVPLGGAEERVIRVDPLGPEDALTLLRARAELARPGSSSGADRSLAAIVAAVEGLPLAIELAAGRLTILSASELASRWPASELLRRRSGPERHRSLEAVVAWSWDLLEPAEQQLLAACAVFAGGFTVDLAEAVVGPGAVPGASVVDRLAALHEASLVASRAVGSEVRLALPEAVRRFAEARLADPGPLWARCASVLAARLDGAPVAALLVERDNLIAALRRPIPAADAARIALLLERSYTSTGPVSARLELAERAVEAARAASDPGGLGRALLARARARIDAGRIEAAEHDLRDAEHHAALAGDDPLRGHVSTRVGAIRLNQGRLDEAEARFAEALAIHRAAADRVGEADGVANLGAVAVSRGAHEQAIHWLLEALPLQLAVGNRIHAAKVMGMLGNAHLQLGRPELALGWYQRGLEVHTAAGHLPGVLRMTANVALVALELGRVDEATRTFRQVIDDAVELGEPLVEGIARENLARCLLAVGEVREAEEQAASAVQGLRALNAGRYVAMARLALALTALTVGDRTRARSVLDTALAECRAASDQWFEGFVLGYRALTTDDPGSASADLDRAGATVTDAGFVVAARWAWAAVHGPPDGRSAARDALAAARGSTEIDAVRRWALGR